MMDGGRAPKTGPGPGQEMDPVLQSPSVVVVVGAPVVALDFSPTLEALSFRLVCCWSVAAERRGEPDSGHKGNSVTTENSSFRKRFLLEEKPGASAEDREETRSSVTQPRAEPHRRH